ncbi:hypothetical protein A2961_02565 [Candidatus Woesebacteria bacterium RIFCSPLOWO2_01_FULL_39_21]|uniref:Metalloprotease TldD/E C-terminal domain-containing protein n=1 Tax=Candidatus Woesebacteria bacterium RIFCSPLOWO2_01_FULL_39_21 TaxID=1802519 RepID=A0A1F8BJZ6_9BACT|nr:MAG: hypothetical protein A2961_02565 [Candidatus Woesebacteria bacterium RIFCSPLOWO2_01_FULL_39_21]
MKKLSDLKRIVKKGLQLIKQERNLIEGVVYASSNHRTVGRICYTTYIPSNGLQEPKSDEDFGVSVEIWFKKGNKKLLGFGQEPNDLSLNAIKRALEKAKRDAVEDSDFTGFLKPSEFKKKYLVKRGYHDKKLMTMTYNQEAKLLSKMSWDTIRGAVDTLSTTNYELRTMNFILNGDNFLIRERMCVASTNGIFDTDETTVVLSFLTAMIENENAKGSAWSAFNKLYLKKPYEAGKEVTQAALKQIGGTRVKTGKYIVIFGPQAVTELFGSLLLSHLHLGLINVGSSIFNGKYGKIVGSPLLNLYDDATVPNAAGTKRITCEGMPTRKVKLIEKGKLVGFLSDSKMTNKFLKKYEESKIKLGVDPRQIIDAISPQNGFRFARGGGRIASSPAWTNATNLIIDSSHPSTNKEVLKKVKNGLYIGRLWYTYPVGGHASGIISGTAIADNFVIRNGELSEPILPNTLRLEDNIGEMMKNIIAIGKNKVQTILWASDEITHAPWVAIKNVNLKEISKVKL